MRLSSSEVGLELSDLGLKSRSVVATFNLLSSSSDWLLSAETTLEATTSLLDGSLLLSGKLHGLRLNISSSKPSLSIVSWLVGPEGGIVGGVESSLLAWHSELKDLKLVVTSSASTSIDLLLANVNNLLGSDSESLGGGGAKADSSAEVKDALRARLVVGVDGETVVTATMQEHLLVLLVIEEVRNTSASEQRSLHQGLFQVADIPDAPLARDFSAEASCNNGIIVSPIDSLHLGTFMGSTRHDSAFSSWVEDEHFLQLAHSTDHLAVGAPLDVGAVVVGKVSHGDDGLVIPIFVDIPNLNSLVDGVRSNQVLNRVVPLDAETLSVMGLNLKVTLSQVTLASQTVEVIEDPHLDLTVVGASSEKTLLEG